MSMSLHSSLDKLYNETVELLEKTRDYQLVLTYRDAVDWDPVEHLLLLQEITRITARLTQAIAWILSQKARQEKSGNDVYPELLFAPEDIEDRALIQLPFEAAQLSEKSRALHERVMRLARDQIERPTSSDQILGNEN